jgi:hypothetical protein
VDYLFVHGKGTAVGWASTSLMRRATPTTLVPQTLAVFTVSEFLQSLRAAAIPKPIGDLLIVAHGSRAGFLRIFLDREQLDEGEGDEVEFETLDNANRSNSVRLPAVLLSNPAGGLVPITLRIHGCEIGRVTKWLTKLRDALQPTGGTVRVIAPRYLDTFMEVKDRGYFEFLTHRFVVTSKSKLTRTQIIDAFADAGFTFADGRAIPLSLWKAWVEKDGNPKGKINKKLFIPVSGFQNRPTVAEMARTYTHYSIPKGYPLHNVPADPGSDTARFDLLRQRLTSSQDDKGRRLWDAGYEYPRYERLGFATFDDFLAGHSWKFSYDKKTLILNCVATRHFYRIEIPVLEGLVDVNSVMGPTETVTDWLTWYNFYPDPGNAVAAVFQLDENNPTLYNQA